MSIIIESAQTLILLKGSNIIFVLIDIPNFIYSKFGILFGNYLFLIFFLIFSQIENRKKLTFLCFLLYGILYYIYFSTKSNENIIFNLVIFLISVLKDYKNIFIQFGLINFI